MKTIKRSSSPYTLDSTLVTFTGNLVIEGVLSDVNSVNTDIADNQIVLNYGETGPGVTKGTAGITVDRGTAANVELRFNESTTKWQASNPVTGMRGILSSVTGNSTVSSDTSPKLSNLLNTNNKVIYSSTGTVKLGTDSVTTGNVILTSNASATFGRSNRYWGSAYINQVYTTTFTGTAQTPAQPNITSVGTITGLTVSGITNAGRLASPIIGNTGASISGATLAVTGTATIGTIQAVNVGNATTKLTGALQNTSHTLITSVGTQTTLSVAGTTTHTGATTQGGILTVNAGTASTSKTTGAVKVTGGVGASANVNASLVNITSNDSMLIPVGPSAGRINTNGMIRYNSELKTYEGYNNGSWDILVVSDVPNVAKTMSFDFINQTYTYYEAPYGKSVKPLQDILTVTRASTASYSDQSGYIRTAAINEPRITYNPDTKDPLGLLIEKNRTTINTYPLDSWKHTLFSSGTGSTPIYLGKYDNGRGQLSADRFIFNLNGGTTTGDQSGFYEPYLTVNGQPYIVTIRIKSATADTYVVRGDFNGASPTTNINAVNGNITVTPEWKTVNVGMVATDTARRLVLRLRGALGTSDYADILVDYIQVENATDASSFIPDATTFTSRASTATYYDSTGTLQTAAINTERLSYNPANLNAEPVKLYENAATNKVLQSSDINAGTAWGKSGTYVGQETINGILLTEINDTSSTANQSYAQSITLSAGVAQCLSVAVKKGTSNATQVSIQGAGVINPQFVIIDWTTTTLSTVTSGIEQAELTNLFDDVYLLRYKVKEANIIGGAAVMYLWPATFVGGGTTTGSTKFGRVQLEDNGFTSYIPTTSTAVTRAADITSGVPAVRENDVITRTLSNEFNKYNGTFYFECATNSTESLLGLISVGDGVDNSSEIAVRIQSGTIRVDAGASGHVISTGYSPTLGVFDKFALMYSSDKITLCINGTVYSVTGITLPRTMNTLALGYFDWFPNNRLNLVNFKELTYYPRAISDYEAITITT